MSVEAIAEALLQVSGVTALVGTRMGLVQLPAPSLSDPSLIFSTISDVPQPPINAPAGGQLMHARLQVTPQATTRAQVLSVQEAVRAALEFKSGAIAGHHVASVLRLLHGPWLFDENTKLYSRPVDYGITYYDN